VEVAAPPQSGRRPLLKRLLTPAVAITVGAILLVAVVTLELVSSRDYIFLPDKAHPVAPLVKVAGGHDPRGSGGIYFVDVIVRKATLLEQIFGGLHSGSDLYPPDQVVSPGVSNSQQEQVNESEMRTSQQVAAAVALRALGKKVTTSEDGAIVSQVEPGFPAARGLRPTDVIVAVNGKPVRAPADVSRVMAGAPVGTAFRFSVLRGARRLAVPLTTVAATRGSRRGVVGVLLGRALPEGGGGGGGGGGNNNADVPPAQQDPDTSDRWADATRIDGSRRFVAHRFPILKDAPIAQTHACHYESTVSGNFIIDKHPHMSNVWIAAGGNAEGFKFSPKIGDYVAQRVMGIEGDAAIAKGFKIPEKDYDPPAPPGTPADSTRRRPPED
jgi:hypothetical protein